MRLAGKLFGVTTAVVFGSLISLAPELVTDNPLATASGPVASLKAEAIVEPRHMARLRAANDAYITARIAIGANGDAAANLARLKESDVAYSEAVTALETDKMSTRHLAKLEAADDAYFAAAMAIETSGKTAARMARLEAAEVTYFKAVTALGNTEKTVRQLTMLKDAQATYARMLIASNITAGSERPSISEGDESSEIVTGSIPQMQTSDAGMAALEKELSRSEEPPVLEGIGSDKMATGSLTEILAAEAVTESPENETAYSAAAGDSELDAVLVPESVKKGFAGMNPAEDADFEAVMATGTAGTIMFMAAQPRMVKVASIAAAIPVVSAAKFAVSESTTQQATLKMPRRSVHTVKPGMRVTRKAVRKSKHARVAKSEGERKGPLRWFFKDVIGGIFGPNRTPPVRR